MVLLCVCVCVCVCAEAPAFVGEDFYCDSGNMGDPKEKKVRARWYPKVLKTRFSRRVRLKEGDVVQLRLMGQSECRHTRTHTHTHTYTHAHTHAHAHTRTHTHTHTHYTRRTHTPSS